MTSVYLSLWLEAHGGFGAVGEYIRTNLRWWLLCLRVSFP
jgi:hypothetical protein